MRYVIDTETDGLKYTKCWVVILTDLDNDKVQVYRNIHDNAVQRQALQRTLDGSTLLVGHNLIGFDLGVLDVFGLTRPPECGLLDTLIVSQLLNYRQEMGHSLEAWGNFFGDKKSAFSDYSRWSQELEDRCIQDTLLTRRLYRYFKRYIEDPSWIPAIRLEHQSALLCNSLRHNGFGFNLPLAESLKEEISRKIKDFEETLSSLFPPLPKFIREITPSITKAGTLHAKDFKWLETKDLVPYSPGAPFSLIEYAPFNPRSPRQVVTRLNAAGWKPTEKTKGHIQAERDGDLEKLKEYKIYGWSVSEDNLATLPETAPEAVRRLAEYLLLCSRLSMLDQFFAAYRAETGSVHGTFNTLGSWSHRKSHQAPNMANIPALKNRKGKPQPYGPEFRSLFLARRGRILVGTDAEGIQLRVFAHLCNDPKLIKAIHEGNKDDGTDIHTLNKDILNTTYNSRDLCKSRESAKTYIYALLLGAGMHKQAQILECTPREALAGLERILQYYPGWKELKDTTIRQDARRGYFPGLDGRKVMFPSAHHILAGYLQNGESVIMKRACLLWHEELQDMNVPFWFVDDVHDEWQTETLPEYGHIVGQTQAKAIVRVGEELGLNCPLAGSYKLGKNWKDTH